MKLSSKNPVLGFVKCQHCGKPAPVHKPKGGPRKNTFYYNCVEHKNQQGRGVHEYIVAEMESTLEAWAEKWDSEEEAAALRIELAACGLLDVEAQPKPETEPEEESMLTINEQQPEGERIVIDNESGQVIGELKSQPKQASSTALLLFIIVCVMLIAGAGLVLVKRFKAANPKPTQQPTSQPPQKTVSNEIQTGMNGGVLL
ncbi:hypothetical protein ACXHPE_04035 [Vibrio cincinnatiensis]|jgi:hypothetical protein